ncbi:CRISPR-associated protein Cas4 [Methanocella sp. MCL-LM]|uniref:CRISPR-associated protein Cas4 n=1 Tax=Methanocella sp. MCL-LM TaxID=3412035 RepID=UPI003C75DF87
MHTFENKWVRVSDISSYLMCPRLAYFRSRGHSAGDSPETVRTDLLREISVSLYSVHSAAEPRKALEHAYNRACDDLDIVYGLDSGGMREVNRVIIDRTLTGLEAEAARLGKESLSKLLKSEATRVSLRSDKLRLSGNVDRIVLSDSQLLPSIISASQPPENGIYASDRIKLAAYALLMSERFGCEVRSGLVEYMGGWSLRVAELRQGDKREALSIRRRIEEGAHSMPDARRGKWCDKCYFKDRCTSRVSFMDSLFGKNGNR